MRKLALLFAAALFVSVPLIAATPTITYAAAKKKAPATNKAAPKGAEGGGDATDLNEVNGRFWRAINDLSISLSRPWPTGADEGGGGAPKGAKGKTGKKSSS